MPSDPRPPAAVEPKKNSARTRLFQTTGRHLQAFGYVLTVILPVLCRTRKKPVIFSRYAGMGDIVCTLPAALELKKRHPGATFIYNCDASSACVPAMGGVTRFITHCRSIGIVGYWYRRLLSGFYAFSSDDDDLLHDDRECSIVAYGKNLGVKVEPPHPLLQVSAAAAGRALALLERFKFEAAPLIILHTGPSSKVRQWPRDQWAGLVRELNRHGFKNIVQLGARAGSYAQADTAETRPLPGVFSLVGELSLEQSIAVISLAGLYVGIDSGLLHVAASVRTPSVGIWGPTTPHFRFAEAERKFFVTSAVECQGCHHRMPRLHWESGCPHDICCQRQVTVPQVLAACLAALQSSPPSGRARRYQGQT